MLGNLLHRGHWPIALDLGSDSIKMLQMQPGSGGLAVRACARWRLPVTAPREGEAWRQLVSGAVREMFRKGAFRGNRVISALSCDQLKIKNIRVPHQPDGDWDEIVHGEASERFGYRFAPGELFYLQAGSVRQGQDTYQEVILLGAPSEVVEDHYALLVDMGLTPVHIDAEPLAMFRPFERRLRRSADENCISVVVDIGHTAAKVIVARGRNLLLIKRIGIGGRDLADAVAKQLSLPYEEAVDLRMQMLRDQARLQDDAKADSDPAARDPISVNWMIVDAIRGQVEELAREIALCLRYCSVTFRGLRAREVTLTGGQAYDAEMVKMLGEQLGVPCEVGRPLKGIDLSAVDLGSDRRTMLAEWGVCTGLALRARECERTTRKRDHEGHRLSA